MAKKQSNHVLTRWFPILLCIVPALVPTVSMAQDQSRDYLKASAVIDRYIEEKLRAKQVVASPLTEDTEFIRRVFLDVVGFTPSADQVLKFGRDSNKDKRERLIIALTEDLNYVERWSDLLTTMIVGRRNDRNRGVNRATMKAWMKEALVRNWGWDRIVNEILIAEGTNEENGAVSFYAKYGPAVKDTTAAVSRIFLGVRISCAQCHDHKFEKWKQEDFWSLASFFARTSQRLVRPRDRTELPYYIVKEAAFDGQLSAVIDDGPKRDKKVVAQSFLDGEPINVTSITNARVELARWVTSPRNPYFAPAIVNRVWGELFGKGIVHPVDDFRDSNPPSHPELLNYLAEDFAAHNYDLTYLIRAILNSKAYQLSAVMTPTEVAAKQSGDEKRLAEAKEAAESTFARALFRPLSPEQMFYSVVLATGGGNEISDAQSRGDLERALSNYLNRFVTLLDNDEGMEQTDFEATIPQALTMINGDLLNSRVTAPKGFLAQMYDPATVRRFGLNTAKRIDYVYLQAVGRVPSAEEKRLIGTLLGRRLSDAQTAAALGASGGGQRPELDPMMVERQVLEDVLWALLNSSEFMFNR